MWPAAWFGNISETYYSGVQPATWRGEPGSRAGYDWGLPSATEPSPRGLLTLFRIFGVLEDPPTTTLALPILNFKVNAVISLWCTCVRMYVCTHACMYVCPWKCITSLWRTCVCSLHLCGPHTAVSQVYAAACAAVSVV